jgi:cardiolipin synthase
MSAPSFLDLLALLLGIVAAGHALLYKRRPQSAFGWIAVCLLVPFAGALLYWLFGINRVRIRARKLRSGQPPPDPLDLTAVRPPAELEALARLGFAVTGMPLVGGNRIDELHDGEQAYPAMLGAIRRAGRCIYLSTYIFDYDNVGREFAAALGEAARRNVDVRVLLDGIGALYSSPPIHRLLREHGVPWAEFLPPRLWPPALHVNLRNHRKILVVDGTDAFVGGMNIGERHLVEDERKGRVADIHFHCRGPVVTQIESVFLRDWQFVTRESLPHTHCEPVADGNALCRAVADGPEEELDRLTELLIGAIGGAERSIYIMTPYFVPPRELLGSLKAAALRGVDVVVILPAVNNLPYIHRATRHMLWEPMQHHVQIYYQPPPFVHSKLMIVDEHYALIGSANMDARSLRLNFELTVEVYDRQFADRLGRFFQGVRARSRPVTLEDVDSRPLPTRVLDGIAWLFSPYL